MSYSSVFALVVFFCIGFAQAKPSFFLPGTIVATPGLECNIYYKNVFSSIVPQNYSYQAQAKVGHARLNRWHWTPEAKHAGTTNEVILNAWSDEGLVACLTTRVVVARIPVNTKKKVAFALFADSLTNSGYQNVIFEEMMKAGCTNFTSVGTRRPRPGTKGTNVPHEGIPGYTCSQFLLHTGVTEDEIANAKTESERQLLANLGKPRKIENGWDRLWVRSPLLRLEGGRPVVDVKMWMDKVNGGKAPDVVMVQLGVNDVLWFKGEEESLRKQIRMAVMPWYRKFLDTLRKEMPKTHFVFTTQPGGTDQDAFGEDYGSGWNEIQHRKIMFALNKEIELFVETQKDACIHLLPLAQAVDPFYGFCNWSMPISAREKTKKLRATNAVHVTASGGAQVADCMVAWLLAHWEELGGK